MMMLYAVAGAEADSAGARATDGTSLQAHHYAGVTVFAEPLTEAPERSTREVLAFGRVLHRLWSHHPVLPVRFGTVLDDEDELGALVAERERAWTERLTAVAGRSECIVHLPLGSASDDPADPADADPDVIETGADYLRRRAAEVRRHEQETAELKAALAPYASETTTLPQLRPGEERLSVLVPDQLVEAARAAVERWAAGSGATVTGPWPPFSFAQVADA